MNQDWREGIEDLAVRIAAGGFILEGNLGIPAGASGIVLFAHGSGSSRHSRRNQFVARVLREGGLATLLFDLLSADEERVDMVTRELRFDIDLLARRVAGAIIWLRRQWWGADFKLGLFGSSTGAAAALIAAAERPADVHAVVSRGGRPDLAIPLLDRVEAPTLLIVGGLDAPVIGMNQEAYSHLRSIKQIEIVPGASHLFEEPGALEAAAGLARDWFRHYLEADPGRAEE
jgi:pimeloyl-ACP methyl ester carboxylesterase